MPPAKHSVTRTAAAALTLLHIPFAAPLSFTNLQSMRHNKLSHFDAHDHFSSCYSAFVAERLSKRLLKQKWQSSISLKQGNGMQAH